MIRILSLLGMLFALSLGVVACKQGNSTKGEAGNNADQAVAMRDIEEEVLKPLRKIYDVAQREGDVIALVNMLRSNNDLQRESAWSTLNAAAREANLTLPSGWAGMSYAMSSEELDEWLKWAEANMEVMGARLREWEHEEYSDEGICLFVMEVYKYDARQNGDRKRIDELARFLYVPDDAVREGAFRTLLDTVWPDDKMEALYRQGKYNEGATYWLRWYKENGDYLYFDDLSGVDEDINIVYDDFMRRFKVNRQAKQYGIPARIWPFVEYKYRDVWPDLTDEEKRTALENAKKKLTEHNARVGKFKARTGPFVDNKSAVHLRNRMLHFVRAIRRKDFKNLWKLLSTEDVLSARMPGYILDEQEFLRRAPDAYSHFSVHYDEFQIDEIQVLGDIGIVTFTSGPFLVWPWKRYLFWHFERGDWFLIEECMYVCENTIPLSIEEAKEFIEEHKLNERSVVLIGLMKQRRFIDILLVVLRVSDNAPIRNAAAIALRNFRSEEADRIEKGLREYLEGPSKKWLEKGGGYEEFVREEIIKTLRQLANTVPPDKGDLEPSE